MRINQKRYFSQNGYALIGLLISLVIVGILASIAITQYRGMGLYDTKAKSPESFARKLDMTLTTHSLKMLHEMELGYHVRYNKYATFQELLDDNLIAAGYTAKLEEQGVPYLEFWDIDIQASEDSYLLLAVPNKNAAEMEAVPILAMNDSGKIWEEEGLEGVDTAPAEEEEEVEFPLVPQGE
jgi:Tfp pilus assembly protein PilE